MGSSEPGHPNPEKEKQQHRTMKIMSDRWGQFSCLKAMPVPKLKGYVGEGFFYQQFFSHDKCSQMIAWQCCRHHTWNSNSHQGRTEENFLLEKQNSKDPELSSFFYLHCLPSPPSAAHSPPAQIIISNRYRQKLFFASTGKCHVCNSSNNGAP